MWTDMFLGQIALLSLFEEGFWHRLNFFTDMEDEMNNNGENYEGVDEIDVSEDGNINEGEEFDFEEIDFGSLN
ncbi:hypothetical protein Lal_00030514 [Lupinus albus]|nr:hypothetical protein Lal_00030514 [Lupinus albus]